MRDVTDCRCTGASGTTSTSTATTGLASTSCGTTLSSQAGRDLDGLRLPLLGDAESDGCGVPAARCLLATADRPDAPTHRDSNAQGYTAGETSPPRPRARKTAARLATEAAPIRRGGGTASPRSRPASKRSGLTPPTSACSGLRARPQPCCGLGQPKPRNNLRGRAPQTGETANASGRRAKPLGESGLNDLAAPHMGLTDRVGPPSPSLSPKEIWLRFLSPAEGRGGRPTAAPASSPMENWLELR
mmetsp:Transcript_36150/g.104011  ORF Transcript_36150/g.104011 Transcript_36150/m.104011 type:complete len:245 (+) Transcript_36150:108-842(+)